jgi:tubulin monoglycylase TTLL3/8
LDEEFSDYLNVKEQATSNEVKQQKPVVTKAAKKYTSTHMMFLLELAEKKRRERQEEERKMELEKKRRERLARAVLSKDGDPAVSRTKSMDQEEGDAVEDSGTSDAAGLSQVQGGAERKAFMNRHFSFLDELSVEKKRKAEEEEQKRIKKEKLRQSLMKKIGIREVGSTKDKWFGFADYNQHHAADDVSHDLKSSKEKENKPHVEAPRHKSTSRVQRADVDHVSSDGSNVKAHKKAVSRPPNSPYRSRVSTTPSKQRQEVVEPSFANAMSSPKKLTAEESSQIFNRLAQPPKRNPVAYASLDLQQFRKRNGIDEGTKVFQISGGYPDLKDALLRRGWFHNVDLSSPFFDYRFVLKASDVPYPKLEKHQMANHFQRNSELTSKVGLCRNIKSASWYEDVDVDTFFPRCYSLDDPEEMDAFALDFKFTAAEAVVREYMSACEDPKAERTITPMDTVAAAIKVTQYRVNELLSLREDRDPAVPQVTAKDIVEEDWDKILNWGSISTINEEELARMAAELKDLPEPSDSDSDGESDSDSDSGDDDLPPRPSTSQSTESALASHRDPAAEYDLDRSMMKSADAVLGVLKRYLVFYDFNGKRNIWIVKPGRKSRGRGIQCFSNFNRLMTYTHLSRREYWVAQKYCENPLVIHKRKFDIRQWVLVMDYEPLIIFFYKEAYLRFCGVDFRLDDVGNRFMHLSNNCVQKHSKNFGEDDLFVGNMWHTDTFREWLQQNVGYDAWTEKLQPAMIDIVRRSLKCGQDAVVARKNSFELFGYDFVVDEHLNPWLLEINSSPDFSYSTPITEALVKEVSEDMVKVTVDWVQNCRNRKGSATCDIGKFELVYRGENFHQALSSVPSMASSLAVQGMACKKYIAPAGQGPSPAHSKPPTQTGPSIINL